MTAAAFAGVLRGRQGEDRTHEVVVFATRIASSQVASALSNILGVTAGAFVLDGAVRLVYGAPLLTQADAEYVYQSLSPLHSGTIAFAALTGVVLWMASVVGGWLDNAFVYYRLADAIREHPAGRWVGCTRLAKLAEKVRHNAGGWATNVSLGMMLGLTPSFGRFFGIPLDVRHVTLNTGTLALAVASLRGAWWHDGWILHALAGVAVMFVLNLSVSFGLSLWNAARAYDLSPADMRALRNGLLRHLVRHPLDFVRAPR